MFAPRMKYVLWATANAVLVSLCVSSCSRPPAPPSTAKPRADDAVAQYDLMPTGLVEVLSQKRYITETTIFTPRAGLGVFSIEPSAATGHVTMTVRWDAPELGQSASETRQLLVDCRSASLEYEGVRYPVAKLPAGLATGVQPVPCDPDRDVVDGMKNDMGPGFYVGTVALYFKLPSQLTQPITVTLPAVGSSVEQLRGGSPGTVEYRRASFELAPGFH
mgnify:CR=1 FL=1